MQRDYQHRVARAALDQRRDLAVPAAAEQVAFPVSGNGPVLYRHQALADQHGVADAAVVRRLLGGGATGGSHVSAANAPAAHFSRRHAI